MEELLRWLDLSDGSDGESTLDAAWGVLRKAWRAKKIGNAAREEDAQRSYWDGLQLVARGRRFMAMDGAEAWQLTRFNAAACAVEGALRRNLSLLAARRQNFEEALSHAEESLRLEPGNPKSRYRRAVALYNLGRGDEVEGDRKIIAKEGALQGRVDRAAQRLDGHGDSRDIFRESDCDCGLCRLSGQSQNNRRRSVHLAAKVGAKCQCQDALERLLDSGAEVNLADADERTPLHLAAANGRQEAVSLLLDARAEPDVLDRHGRSPLYYAACANHRDVVALLVERGQADQSILFHALKEKFGTHNFMLHDWPEYNGRWMSSGAQRARSKSMLGQVAKDIEGFRWGWLKQVTGQEVQMCQLFCGSEGFSPCHYDPQ
ncbi:unnamed protein product, partial [Effrenium voratum]